jgi:DNA-directed RNA polymerase subunit alpha
MAEDRKSGEIGVIAVDALFSPVVNVNYKVEPTRVGRRIDLDKLIIDVETDGTIKPLDALNSAAKILSDTFKQVYEPGEMEEAEEAPKSGVQDEVLKMSIEEIDLPVRIANALKAIDVNTVEELINIQRVQLLKAKNLGAKSLSLISEKLAERGLSLSEA